MGNRNKALTAVAVAGAVMLSGCSKVFDDDSSRPAPTTFLEIPAADPLAINVLVVDPDGVPIDAAGTKILVRDKNGNSGDSADADLKRIGLAGTTTPATSVTTDTGIASFSLVDKNDKVSTGDPLELIFVATNPDFLRSSATFVADKDNEDYIVNIQLTPISGATIADKPITVTSQPVTTKSDGSLAATSVVTPTKTGVKGTTQLSIPDGTKVTVVDENGNQTTAQGALKVVVAYYENDTSAGTSSTFNAANNSLNVFPGGLDVEVPSSDVDSSSSAASSGGRISFSSAGFTSIEIRDEAGNLVKNFDQPIDIQITVPKGTPSPDPLFDTNNNKVVDAGESVPVWSYDEITGKWTREKNSDGSLASVALAETSPVSDVLVGIHKTDHLSYFNLDFYGSRCTPSSITFNLLDKDGVQYKRKSNFTAYQSGGGWSRMNRGYSNTTETITLANMPDYRNLTVELQDPTDNSRVLDRIVLQGGQTLTATDGRVSLGAGRTLCDLAGANVFSKLANPEFKDVIVKLVAACPDGSKAEPFPTVAYSFSNNPYYFSYASTRSTGTGKLTGLNADVSYPLFTYNRSTGRYDRKADFTPRSLVNNTLTVRMAEKTESECAVTPPPTGATGGTGGTGGTGASGTTGS